jgi:hypothetical protein
MNNINWLTWKKNLKIFVFLALLLSVCFLILELLMLFLEPLKGFCHYDADLGFKVRAYAQGANRFGFNGRDYPLEKNPAVFRILIVGDSFNWAGGKEKNYCAFLERKFQAYYHAHRVEVINSGYPGTHTGEQFPMLKKFGMQYHPDLVVLGFFVGNDFVDANPYRKRIMYNDAAFDIDRRQEITWRGYPIILQSWLFTYIKQKFQFAKELALARYEAWATNGRLGVFSENTFLEIEKFRLDFCNRKWQETGRYRGNINFILQNLGDMHTYLAERQIPFLVALYPDEFQVNPVLLAKLMQKYRLKPEDYDLRCAQNLLINFCARQQIPVVDLLPDFQTAGRSQELYIFQDSHWNDQGNELAADLLFPVLLPYAEKYFSR